MQDQDQMVGITGALRIFAAIAIMFGGLFWMFWMASPAQAQEPSLTLTTKTCEEVRWTFTNHTTETVTVESVLFTVPGYDTFNWADGWTLEPGGSHSHGFAGVITVTEGQTVQFPYSGNIEMPRGRYYLTAKVGSVTETITWWMPCTYAELHDIETEFTAYGNPIVTVRGRYWEPGETVRVTIYSEAGVEKNQRVTADENGRIRAQFYWNEPNGFVKASAPSGADGIYEIGG